MGEVQGEGCTVGARKGGGAGGGYFCVLYIFTRVGSVTHSLSEGAPMERRNGCRTSEAVLSGLSDERGWRGV